MYVNLSSLYSFELSHCIPQYSFHYAPTIFSHGLLLPLQLEHCPRALLLRDTVHYCTSDEIGQYKLAFVDARDGATANSAKGVDTPLGVENVDGAEAGEVQASMVDDVDSTASAVAASLHLSEDFTHIEEGIAPSSSSSSSMAAGVQLVWAKSKAVVVTPPEGLIFVLRDGTLYAAEKTTVAPR